MMDAETWPDAGRLTSAFRGSRRRQSYSFVVLFLVLQSVIGSGGLDIRIRFDPGLENEKD
jgi:hypothetical protein